MYIYKLIQKCIKLFLYYNILLQNIPPLLLLIWQVYSSISLVFLLATILTFVLQKSDKLKCTIIIDYFCCIFFIYRSLWNMRNYIHCMLCGSMFTAQLLYTFGINKTENEVYTVTVLNFLHSPVSCRLSVQPLQCCFTTSIW